MHCRQLAVVLATKLYAKVPENRYGPTFQPITFSVLQTVGVASYSPILIFACSIHTYMPGCITSYYKLDYIIRKCFQNISKNLKHFQKPKSRYTTRNVARRWLPLSHTCWRTQILFTRWVHNGMHNCSFEGPFSLL